MAEDETNGSQRAFEAGAASAAGESQRAAQGGSGFPHGAQGNGEFSQSGNGGTPAAGGGGGGSQAGAGAGDGGGNTGGDGGGDGGGTGGDGTGGGGGTGGDGGGDGGDGTGGDGASEGLFGQMLGQLPDGLPPVGGIGDNGIVDTVNQVVSGIGSGGPLNDILNSDLLGSITDQLNDLLDGGIGGDGLGGLVETVVADASQTVGAVAGGGSADGILDAVGSGIGTLVDDVIDGVGGVVGGGAAGGILDGLGGDILTGSTGGAGLLSGTPLEGLQGDGALLSANTLRADDSSSSNTAQAGVGTDLTQSLLNVDAASDRSTSESNHIVDTDFGPQASGSGVSADLAGADQDSSGALVDVDIGQHQGPSLVDINAGTSADSFQIPLLDGAGLDSLVGEVGDIAGDPIGGGDLLPVSAGVDGQVLLDTEAVGTIDAGDNHVEDGTHLMVNTPLQGGLGLG
jgi:hypothetical protein